MTTRAEFDRAYLQGYSAGSVGRKATANPFLASGRNRNQVLAEIWERGRTAAATKRSERNVRD